MSAMAFWRRSVSVGAGARGGFWVLRVVGGGREAFVILLGVGPKARVCWARAVGLEGLRRVAGMMDTMALGL